MWGHLSGIIQLVDVQELECKPGESLGLLFTVYPSALVPGEERECSIPSPLLGLFFHRPRAELPSEDPGWVEEAGLRE